MFIVSTGMVCAVGLNAAAACAAMRAGLAGFAELPYVDNQGEPIVGAMVPGLDPDLKRTERLVEMLSMALTDCLNKHPGLNIEEIPLLVGLAEPGRPGGGAELADFIIGTMQERLAIKFHPGHSKAIPKGHTAAFEALRIARDLFTHDASVPACLVCGADSYINAPSLLWFDEQWRLKRREHSDGVIPGEAGAAFLVSRTVYSGKDPSVQVTGIGVGFEEASVMSEQPLRADGLAEAETEALRDAGLEMHEMDVRCSDVTGESYGFKEQALALARVMRQRREELTLWHCSDAIGDSGAVAGAVQIVAMSHAFWNDYAPGPRAICCTSSVSGDRAAIVICRDERQRRGDWKTDRPLSKG